MTAYLTALGITAAVLVAGVVLGVILSRPIRRDSAVGRIVLALCRQQHAPASPAAPGDTGDTAPPGALSDGELAYLDQIAAFRLPANIREGGRTIADELRKRTPAVSDTDLCSTILTAHAFLAAALEAGDPAPHADGALDVLAAAATDLAAAPRLNPDGARR